MIFGWTNDIFTEQNDTEDVPSLTERRVMFAELVSIPKRECKANTRKKTFQTHLLSSPQNQLIICKAEEVSKKKEEHQIKRQNAMKEVIQDEKKINKTKRKLHEEKTL